MTLTRKTRGKNVTLTLMLKGESATLNLFDGSDLSKSNLFCYGNLFMINRYCLLVLFRFLDASENKTFESNFMDYLSSCDDDEIKRILIIIAQSLTIFAEYNFNSSLPLSDDFINEIHYVDKGITYHIPELGRNYYQALCDLTLHENRDQKIQKTQESLLTHYKDESVICLYGNQIGIADSVVTFQEQDFSGVSAELFSDGGYIETRPQTDKSPLLERELKKESTSQIR